MGSNKVALQAQQYASAKGELIRATKYSDLTAQNKSDIGNTGFQDEVVVGTETAYDATTMKKDVTIRVYRTGESVPRSSLVVTRYSKSMDTSSVPSGSIIPWYGNLADIPDGFALCNGTNGTPDLRDRFLVGAGSSYALSATGGADTVMLTGTQVGNHYHTFGVDVSNNSGFFLSRGVGNYVTPSVPSGVRWQYWNGSGSDAHMRDRGSGENLVTSNSIATAAQEAHENRPPFYALYYIMKL